MWSDLTPPERLRALAAGLHSVLPTPSPVASSTRRRLRGKASIEQLAELLRDEPGFAWLNGESAGPYLLYRPLAAVSYSGGYGVITGPGGAVEVERCGF